MLEIIKEHIGFRKQIFMLAKADIIKTYKGAALGWLWAFVKPVTNIFVYWFVFSFGLRTANVVDKQPFFLWLVVGIVPWFYMAEMLSQGTNSIRRYSYLVTKMKFPVSTIPTFVSLSKLLIHILMISIVIVLLLLKGYSIDIYYLQLPFYMFLMYFFFTMWTLFATPLAAISKDFTNLIKSIVSPIFWVSGILWDPNSVEMPLLKNFLFINPITYLVQGYRDTLLNNKIWFFEKPYSALAFFIVLSIMTILAIGLYKIYRKEIADVL